MAEPERRADAISRRTSQEAWDVGLRTSNDKGPIDVGLSIEPGLVGLVIEAPDVGVLKMAFETTSEGICRLTQASRRLADGRGGLVATWDDSKMLELKAELERSEQTCLSLRKEFEARIQALTVERDEARAVARQLHARVASSKRDVQLANLQIEAQKQLVEQEREGRIHALRERDELQARLTASAAQTDGEPTLLIKP